MRVAIYPRHRKAGLLFFIPLQLHQLWLGEVPFAPKPISAGGTI
jgi:hypothetical protein